MYKTTNQVDQYSAAGPIRPIDGTVFLSGSSGIAMTLPAPGKSADGTTLTIISTTAQAHTVTVSAGFNGAGSGADVATFGGAVGDGLVAKAFNGVWYVVSLRNVTLG